MIYLIRHGRAAAGFGDHADPGLDDIGRRQAETAAEVMAPRGPLLISSSPLRRAQETATPLAHRWQTHIQIEPRMAEIPSPVHLSLQERPLWLSGIMNSRYGALDHSLQQWFRNIESFLLSCTQHVAVFSHFIAINAAVALARNDDQVVSFRPDNASITVIDCSPSGLRLVQLGQEAQTQVG